MKLKRFLCLALVLTCCFSVCVGLCACDKNEDDDEWRGSSIKDSDAFLFTMKLSQGKIVNTSKFEIVESSHAFTLYKKNCINLFGIGGGHDIKIAKENTNIGCYCHQKSFDYKGIDSALIGSDVFTVKRKVLLFFH